MGAKRADCWGGGGHVSAELGEAVGGRRLVTRFITLVYKFKSVEPLHNLAKCVPCTHTRIPLGSTSMLKRFFLKGRNQNKGTGRVYKHITCSTVLRSVSGGT